MAEYVIVVQDEEEEPRGEALFTLEPRTPFLSKRRESAFWKRTGEELADVVVSSDLPFEAVTLFLKKARRAARRRVSLCKLTGVGDADGWRVLTSPSKSGEAVPPMTEDERMHFEEARLLAEEISKRNKDAIPDFEDELITLDELEELVRGEHPEAADD